jgi:hypothetical protein
MIAVRACCVDWQISCTFVMSLTYNASDQAKQQILRVSNLIEVLQKVEYATGDLLLGQHGGTRGIAANGLESNCWGKHSRALQRLTWRESGEGNRSSGEGCCRGPRRGDEDRPEHGGN